MHHLQIFRALAYSLLGILALAALFALAFAHVHTVTYRIVLAFLTLIFLSNLVTKAIVAYFEHRQKQWQNG